MQASMPRHHRFAQLATRVARGIARLERARVCCGELTLQQFDTLRLIRAGEATTPSQVASALGIDISTASRNLAVLQRGGYVVRQPSPSDARVVTLELSSTGQSCWVALSCDQRALFEGLMAKVPAAQRAVVMHALELLDSAIAAQESCCATGRASDPTHACEETSPIHLRNGSRAAVPHHLRRKA